jgi:multimeric flavodoxin WrbA
MANAVAEGAREAGASVDIKRVPELVPAEVAKASHYKLDQAAPVAKVEELANYDAVIVGTGTRFGRMASQMANFLDQAGGLWARRFGDFRRHQFGHALDVDRRAGLAGAFGNGVGHRFDMAIGGIIQDENFCHDGFLRVELLFRGVIAGLDPAIHRR